LQQQKIKNANYYIKQKTLETPEQRAERLLIQQKRDKNRRANETEEKRKKRLSKHRETMKIYRKQKLLDKQKKEQLLKQKSKYTKNKEKTLPIDELNIIMQKFFNNYHKDPNSQKQSSKFPPDHKESGFCYCSVCNKPGSSHSM
jgi:hypothetical protein